MAHSAIVGGSTAGRLLACPASYRATLDLPPSAQIESDYALEGSAMHIVMANLLQWRQEQEPHHLVVTQSMLLQRAEIFLGTRIGSALSDGGRIFTPEHLNEMISPSLSALSELEDIYESQFKVIGVETQVRFPGVPGAFGTVDLILQSPSHILHVDWKFGQGIGVAAIYPDEEGDIVNSQLMFYATAGYHTRRARYTRRKIGVAIIQPRGDEPLSHTLVSRKELGYFVEDINSAVMQALEREPPIKRGEHCRFAPCKTICPLWSGPLLDLSALKPVEREHTVRRQKVATLYGIYLSRAKALADQMALFKKTLDEQLHAYLTEGGVVPGWRLKQKTKMRQWVNEETVEQSLTELGFERHDIWQRKLQTFAAADAAARRLGVKIPDELRIAPLTSETTIAPESDPAPVVEPSVVIEQFAESLKQLRKEPRWIAGRQHAESTEPVITIRNIYEAGKGK